MQIKPRKHDDEKAKGLVQKIISELPKDFISGEGEATAHLSKAYGGTIKIYPTPGTKSKITCVTVSESIKEFKSNWNSIFFQYKEYRFFIIAD